MRKGFAEGLHQSLGIGRLKLYLCVCACLCIAVQQKARLWPHAPLFLQVLSPHCLQLPSNVQQDPGGTDPGGEESVTPHRTKEPLPQSVPSCALF